MCWAAVATYFGFYPAMLVPPLIMIDKKCNVSESDVKNVKNEYVYRSDMNS